jgi:acyl-[acyl-carrier-protein] desaturase
MMFYTVFQERATQLNYVNLGLVAKGEWEHEAFKNDEDPVLAEMCKHIAADEAAHYNFFLEGARLFLYYFPEKAVECMADVLRHFAMPARDIIPNYDKFGEILHRTAVFGLRQHHRDVVKVGLEQLGAVNLRKVEEGIRKSREVPDENGEVRRTTIFETLDFQFIENKVKRLFKKVQDFEGQIGLDKVAPTHLVANPELTAYLTGKPAPEPA